jgi:hypothetical protein
MNLRGLQDYNVNGKALSVGTPNEATAYKAPQLNTASITAGSFNSGITSTAYASTSPAIPFFLTDIGPGGAPYVQINQSVGVSVTMTQLTFTKLPFLVSNATGISFGTLKLLTFPFGRFSLNGGSLIFTSVDASRSDLCFARGSSTAATVIDAAFSGDISLGTTGTTDATLNSTDVDILASTALLDPAVAGVTNNLATPAAVLNGPTEFDGSTTTTTGTAKSLNLNIIIDDEDVADASSHMLLLTGFLRIYTSWLGDF